MIKYNGTREGEGRINKEREEGKVRTLGEFAKRACGFEHRMSTISARVEQRG